ncbi:menaquinol-cytochrome c reductase cytochrome c subunit domain protein [Mycobacterium xenopi 4042]|uniref:Menaquinol-cytochrome c reductase cytochrome c subunit domain protein n=1 Tax=Mycobacterium xenopi 4042 TaxID=1299334 RepID=X8DC64_MYCXE|nr:menaquinol-cytochrome c reductase cytochrome c subunit domain protein [Mycobacterium xenopi 4042]
MSRRPTNRSARLKTNRSRRRLRRRLSGGLLLVAALALAGGLAAVLTPKPQVAVADESSSALLRTGKQLFDTSCVTCHGANLQGVPGRGPSLIGVGEAAVYFQVSTGRMPAVRGEAQAPRKDPIFDEAQIEALGAYVQANGGGPTLVREPDGSLAQKSLRGKDLGRGGDLFRLNCASCHNFTGKGGALSSGKYAPDLGRPTSSKSLPRCCPGRRTCRSSPTGSCRSTRRKTSSPTSRPSPKSASPAATVWAASVLPRGHGDVDHRDGRRHRRSTVDWGAIMTDIGDQARTDADRHQEPDEAALAAMSREELVALGGRLDGVETVYKQPRWPVQGTRAEKRAERQVALWLLAGGFFGLALLLVFLFWPWEYKPKEASGSFLYSLTTPLYGLTFGLSIMSIAVGAVLFQKKFIPEEISIQERHDNRSPKSTARRWRPT